LTQAQEAQLQAKANADAIGTIQDGVDWARETHQVAYTDWGMRWVFERLALRQKVPRPRFPKASAAQPEAWKRGLTARLDEAGYRAIAGLFWGDEMRVGLMGQVRQVCAPRRVKVEQAVEYERGWAYLNSVIYRALTRPFNRQLV